MNTLNASRGITTKVDTLKGMGIDYNPNTLSQTISGTSINSAHNLIPSENGGGYISIGEVSVPLSEEEFQTAGENDVYRENLVSFYEELQKANLTGLWNFRNDIFTSLQNTA
jgi:hypothetical protein